MIEVYILLLFVTIISYYIEKEGFLCFKDRNTNSFNCLNAKGCVFFLITVIILVLFVGLRTRMNDTLNYINAFNNAYEDDITSISNIDFSIGSNPLFSIYNIVVKSMISNSANVMIFISSIISVSLCVVFIKDYSYSFWLTMFFYIAFTVYAASAAMIKQEMAIAIGIWSIPLILSGHKIKALLLLIVAMLIHPYVVVFFLTYYFANKKVWHQSMFIILALAVAAFFLFDIFLDGALLITDIIGENYSEYRDDFFSSDTGVSVFRFLFYTIIPILSFLGRKQIRQDNNRFYSVCINLSIIAMCISLITIRGGAVLLGRLPNYFDIIICIALPYVIGKLPIIGHNVKRIITIIIMAIFLGFYTAYYMKYFYISGDQLLGSFYDRINILELIERW